MFLLYLFILQGHLVLSLCLCLLAKSNAQHMKGHQNKKYFNQIQTQTRFVALHGK